MTNQVAFDAAKSCNQPALGGVWRSAPSRRLLLERLNDSSPIRYATVLKGTFKNVKTASYVLLVRINLTTVLNHEFKLRASLLKNAFLTERRNTRHFKVTCIAYNVSKEYKLLGNVTRNFLKN